MERRVTVNDRIERFKLEVPAELEEAVRSAGAPGLPAQAQTAQGPCLYFGPSGQRCSRPARAGGYCGRHGSAGAHGDKQLPARNYSRVLTATVAIIVVVWPYIADFVHDLIRWLAAR